MVEFAIILPILALLLVMAIDLGRVFFGWVGLQNVARIAANHAGGEPDAWTPPLSAGAKQQARDRYADLIANEAAGLNCVLGVVEDPRFEDTTGDGDTNDPGDMAIVEVTCGFGLITPLASNIVGGTINLGAKAEFPVRRTIDVALPPPPPPPPPPCAPPVASFTTVPVPTGGGRVNVSGGTAVAFTNTSTSPDDCDFTTFEWDFDDAGATSTLENPTHTFNDPAGGGATNFDVTLTVTNNEGSDTDTITVRATS